MKGFAIAGSTIARAIHLLDLLVQSLEGFTIALAIHSLDPTVSTKLVYPGPPAPT